MKKYARVLAMLLALVMILGVFSGCKTKKVVTNTSTIEGTDGTVVPGESGTEGTDGTDGTGGSGGRPNTDDMSDETKKELEKIPGLDTITSNGINFGGRTVVVGMWTAGQDGTGTDDAGLRYKALNEYVEKTYNCKLEFKIYDNGRDPALKTSIMSGQPSADMFATQGVGTFYEYYSAGCLTAMEDLQHVQMNDTSRFYVPELTAFTDPKSNSKKHYGLTTVIFSWMSKAFSTSMLVNFDITSAVGYTAGKMYEMQNAGNWTWAEFEKLCGLLKTKGYTPMSEISDTYTTYAFDSSFTFYSGMLYANNTDWIKKDNRTFTFIGGEGPALEVLNQYVDWAKKGYITYTQNNWDDFKNKKTAFLPTVYVTPIIHDGAVRTDSTIGLMYIPVKSAGMEYQSPQYQQTYVVIPRGVQNAQGVGAVFNALNTPIFSQEESNALNEKAIANTAKVRQSKETMVEMYSKQSTWRAPDALYGVAASLGYTGDDSKKGWFDYVKKIALGEMNTQQAIDEFSGRAKSVLETTYQ